MKNAFELVSAEQFQYLIYLGLSLAVMLLSGILYSRDPLLFRKFFGKINPLITMSVIIILGSVLLTFLMSQGWFAIYTRGNLKGLLISAGLGALLALVMILFDFRTVFPDDLNALFPDSVLYYPTMGFVVEIIFHVLPLSILLIVLTSLSGNLSFDKMIWPAIFVVALLEPIFQTYWGFSRPYSVWILGFVGLHIFLINLAQLIIFKRYDFVSMYTLRLVYYLFWHIVWGYVRLRLLF